MQSIRIATVVDDHLGEVVTVVQDPEIGGGDNWIGIPLTKELHKMIRYELM